MNGWASWWKLDLNWVLKDGEDEGETEEMECSAEAMVLVRVGGVDLR